MNANVSGNVNISPPVTQNLNSPQEALCNHQEANVRAEPSATSASVYILKYGERVKVYRHVGDWAYVETKDGTRGYVRDALLSALQLEQ